MEWRSAQEKKRYKRSNILILAKVFVLVALAFVSAARRDNKERRIVRLNDFDNCKDRPSRPWHFLHKTITVVSKSIYLFNAEGICERATQTIEKVVANFTKCTDKSKTKCEYSHKMEFKSGTVICPLFLPKLTPWWSILKSFSPHLNCANRKGNFTVRNMTIEFDAISDMQFVANDYWTAQWEFFDQNFAPWACIYGETDFPKVKN